MAERDKEPARRARGRPDWRLFVVLILVSVGLVLLVSSGPTRDSTSPGQRPIRLVLAMDLSTSMNCPVQRQRPPCADPRDPKTNPPAPRNEGETRGLRIKAAVDGTVGALEWFGPRDRLAIWTFSGNSIVDQATRTTFSGKRSDPAPSGRIPLFKDAATTKSSLRGLLLNASGGTPLNLAIYYGVRALRANWQPGLNTLVILTDGYDSKKSKLNGIPLDEARLNRLLSQGSQAPVHVLVTAADYDVDCDGLLQDVTAFIYEPDRDCFPVSEDSDINTTFEHVHRRLQELALS